jgi:hypothetical protein
MNGLSICWRGPPGSGKRHALHQQLGAWANQMGQVFSLRRQLWDAPLQGGEAKEEEEEEASDEKALLPMEVSCLHWGFDVARMSLQDKQYIKSILNRWGRGSTVLSTSQANSQRCLVFYHAHLLSCESVILLQAFLEENYQDSILWLTSEHPLPIRLADWCIEIPVKGEDRALSKLNITEPILTIEDEINFIYQKWLTTPPLLSDVKKIRAIVYALLHRNIRWTDGFHLWLFGLERLPLTLEQKLILGEICKRQPFTGAGQTVPSYRIPVLWENYLLCLRNALAPPPPPSVPVEAVIKNRKKKKENAQSSN